MSSAYNDIIYFISRNYMWLYSPTNYINVFFCLRITCQPDIVYTLSPTQLCPLPLTQPMNQHYSLVPPTCVQCFWRQIFLPLTIVGGVGLFFQTGIERDIVFIFLDFFLNCCNVEFFPPKLWIYKVHLDVKLTDAISLSTLI